MTIHTNVNFAAATAVIVSSALTIASVMAFTNPAISTAAMVAFGILAALGTAAGFAGISAWYRTNSGRVSDFVRNFKNDFVFATIGVIKLVADSLFKAVVNGFSQAVSGAVHDRVRYGRR